MTSGKLLNRTQALCVLFVKVTLFQPTSCLAGVYLEHPPAINA